MSPAILAASEIHIIHATFGVPFFPSADAMRRVTPIQKATVNLKLGIPRGGWSGWNLDGSWNFPRDLGAALAIKHGGAVPSDRQKNETSPKQPLHRPRERPYTQCAIIGRDSARMKFLRSIMVKFRLLTITDQFVVINIYQLRYLHTWKAVMMANDGQQLFIMLLTTTPRFSFSKGKTWENQAFRIQYAQTNVQHLFLIGFWPPGCDDYLMPTVLDSWWSILAYNGQLQPIIGRWSMIIHDGQWWLLVLVNHQPLWSIINHLSLSLDCCQVTLS